MAPDFSRFQEKILHDPVWFCEEVLGVYAWEKQIEMIEAVRDYMKTMVAGCVASGKTYGEAALVLWFMLAFAPSARVFCLAPTERQLKINLWGQIPQIYHNANIPLGGELMPLSLQYRMGEDWYAMGFSPQDKMGVFGIHGPHDLLIIDDAQGIKQEIWDALENATAGGTTKILASCNPVVTSGEIYQAMTSNRKGYKVIRIPADSTPNVKEGRIVIPGMITKDVVDRWVKDYGPDSDFVRTKVHALLPKQEPDTLVPLDWIELGRNREIAPGDHITTLGVDVARFGDDDTVLFPVRGRQALDPIILHGNDTMQVTGQIVNAIREYRVKEVYLDVIGIGAGVYDRLNEHQKADPPLIPRHVSINAVNVGEKAKDAAKFVNLRSEIWWAARLSLDPKGEAPMALCKNDELMAELAAPKYTIESAGKIKVESKDDMKERLGRSPDLADAYCLAVFKKYSTRAKPSVAAFAGAMPGAAKVPDWI